MTSLRLMQDSAVRPAAWGSLVLGLFLFLTPTMADDDAGPTTRSSIEDRPLVGVVPGRADDTRESRPQTGLDIGRVLVALTVVVGLILVMWLVMRRRFAVARALSGERAVKVLSRSVVAPRQQVMLLQVGRRIVVVGDSGGAMSSLAQITEADEVAELVEMLRPKALDRDAAPDFAPTLDRAIQATSATMSTADAPQSPNEGTGDDANRADTARSELNELLTKIKVISQQVRRN